MIDVHPRRVGHVIGGARVVSQDDLQPVSPYQIGLSVAGSRPRGEIRAVLKDLGRREDFDFVFAA